MITILRNPKALDLPEMKELIERVLRDSPWDKIPNVDREIARLIENPRAGVFAGWEQGWKAFAIALLPESPLDPIPQVIHLYNVGTNSLRRELIQYIVDFIGSAGYNKFWAVNATGRGDRAWAKVMRPDGWEVNPIGSIMEFSSDKRD